MQQLILRGLARLNSGCTGVVRLKVAARVDGGVRLLRWSQDEAAVQAGDDFVHGGALPDREEW